MPIFWDSDTKAALDLAADEAMREYYAHAPDSLLSARQMKRILCDGVCRITDVTDDACLPCVGYLKTDLGEKFPLFSVFTREAAKTLQGARVYLQLRMSERGTRYVTGVERLPVDGSTPYWPCPKCWSVAQRRETSIGTIYECLQCHYQMEVGP